MLPTTRSGGSLRLWVGMAMAAAVLPLGISAVLGYLLLNHGVIAAFEDVASRQRHQLDPMQDLRLMMLEAAEPVDEFLYDADATRPAAYRELRQRIEAAFADLHDNLADEPGTRALVARARDDWWAADRIATEAISARRAPGDTHGSELMHGFHGLINTAVDKLRAAVDDIEGELRRDHDEASLYYERAQWIAGIAAAVSALSILAGALLLGRMMSSSVDRLVDGAARFAAGDRDHRIEVKVPPELNKVAAEFNRMISRIDETEAALADQARRDPMTLLPNRRAFDEALAEALARVRRAGEGLALLALDIDHFKRINDTYGHSAGDDVLRIVARTMDADVRAVDHLFRTGGEEFAVLLSGVDAATAEQTAERLRQAVEARPIPVEGEKIGVTISIGLATATADTDADALMNAADEALYDAKTQGRNRVVSRGEAEGRTGA